MTQQRDIDRLLDLWLSDGPTHAPDRVIDVVADRIERQPQRPAWRFHLREYHVNTYLKPLAAVAAVVLVAVIGFSLFGGSSRTDVGGPGPSASSSPSASPSPMPAVVATPRPSSSSGSNILDATGWSVPLTLTVGDGWRQNSVDAGQVDLLRGDVDLGIHPIALVTLPGATEADPWIAVPSDFVAWIKRRPEFVPSEPRSVTIGGRSGTSIDAEFVRKTGTTERDFLRYTTGGWRYDQGLIDAGARVRFIILPGASGEAGVMLVMNAKDSDFDAAAASLDKMLSTLRFEAPASPSPS